MDQEERNNSMFVATEEIGKIFTNQKDISQLHHQEDIHIYLFYIFMIQMKLYSRPLDVSLMGRGFAHIKRLWSICRRVVSLQMFIG